MKLNQGTSRRLIVGVSGASGTVYAQSLLRQAAAAGLDVHLIVSKAARLTANYELGPGTVIGPAAVVHANGDLGASVASGSFVTMGMVVVPCSVKTMSEIATGVTGSLISRAADVCLKERRRLVLMVRETPFHLGHLRTMTALAEMGAIIAPPLPAFYAAPTTLDEMVDQSVARVLDLFGIESPSLRRWRDTDQAPHD